MWTPKVAMITPFYPPSTGGMERFVAQLTTKLRSRGVHVKVITGNHFGSNGYEEDVVHLNTRLVVIGNPVIPSLISELTSDDYDIMHAHDEHALTSNIAAFSKTLKGTPFCDALPRLLQRRKPRLENIRPSIHGIPVLLHFVKSGRHSGFIPFGGEVPNEVQS